MNAKFLLRKYLNTGMSIPEYQFNKLNTNLRTTYIRKRSIAIESGQKSQSFEEPYISKDTWIKSVEKNPWNIQYIQNPTDEVQDYILKNHKAYIFHIKNPNNKIKPLVDSEEYQMRSLKYSSFDIEHIENPTDEVQDYILKNYKEYIFHIKNPNDKIKSLLDLEEYQMYVVVNRLRNIELIKNPTPKVQMYVVEKNTLYARFIKNPTDEVQMYVFQKEPWFFNNIKNPTPKVQMYVVKKDSFNIKDIQNPTPQVQMVAIKDEPYNIRYVKNPTDEVQDYILDNYPEYIFYIKTPNDKIKPLLDLEEYQMYAVKKDPFYVSYIKNPTDEVQNYILKNHPRLIKHIKNPNEKIKRYLLGNNINENTKKMKIILKESQIKNIISDIINKNDMSENYMFFSNLKQIKRQCELLLELNTEEVDNIIKNGHDWADDHISEAKNNMDQVFDFFMNETSNHEINEGKNKPTNPKLWQASLAWAKTKYDVCPSAYCNGAAAKRYKSKGGGWKKSITEIKNNNFETYHKTYTSAINDALDYAEKKGYTYDNDEVFTKIAMGPKKPKEGDTNRFSISLKKDDKEQKKSLNIQVYGMKETYELNCYIN
jgi:hypothetical protein